MLPEGGGLGYPAAYTIPLTTSIHATVDTLETEAGSVANVI
jgi:hypothetical protein